MIIFSHLLNDRSGSPTVLRATLEALDARSDGMLFIGSQGRGVLEEACVPTRRYWYRRSRFRIVTLLTYLFSQMMLYRALSRTQNISSDAVVFVNTLLPFGAMVWAKRRKLPIIIHIHEISITPMPLRVFLLTCARRCATILLYVSHDHLARLPIVGPSSLVLYNPVCSKVLERAALHVRKARQHFVVLMLASPRAYKGLDEFFALATALEARGDICFQLVLNADLKETQALAARHGGLKNLTIHPRTENPSDFYEQADLVVNLSRVDQWIETFGLTLAEAMTFGLPVIAPPVGGPSEIVSHGENGFCIDSRDTKSLSDAVVKLVDNPDVYEAMSEAARIKSKDFAVSAYAANLQTIVCDLRKRKMS